VTVKPVNTEADWEEMCARKEGLTVVDVYTEWSGPCTAMQATLKRAKLEVGDDSLQYVMARSDTIPALHMFRNHLEPVWLFVASGNVVAVMHGANAPLMKVMVAQEVAKERAVLAGLGQRREISLQEILATNGEENEKEDAFVDWLKQFEPSYPEIIENIREAVQKKIKAEQGCLKNEPDQEEAENADPEKDESLNPDGEDDEQVKEEE